MYVILCNDDDSLYGSHKERIMQRSNCVENLVFIVNSIYRNTYDMTNATVLLEYLLPVSKRYKTEILTLSDERYKDCFLQYKLPINTEITSEAGSVQLQLTFAYVEMDEHGKGIQRVRKTSTTTIDVIPISAWSDIIPDQCLGGLDQRLIMMNSQLQALNDYMNVIDNKQVDDLVYDSVEDTLQLHSNGVGVGSKVSVKDILDDGIPVVELGSSSGDNSKPDHNDGCNCGCEDNVVEFGDYPETDNDIEDDDNVVEF